MKIKNQVIHDFSSDKFRHIQRDENKIVHRVDINELNKRLNRSNRSNFYTTVLFIILCLSGLVVLSLRMGVFFKSSMEKNLALNPSSIS